MKTIHRVPVQHLLLAVVALSAGCQAVGGHGSTETRVTEVYAPLTGITRLKIVTNVGDITVKSANVNQCQIVARISAQAGNATKASERAERIPVCVTSIGDVLHVKVLSPSVLGTNPYRVELAVVAPRNLALDCLTDVGSIQITGFDEELTARTSVGNILCTGVRAALRLRTDVGDIRAVYEKNASAALDAEMKTGVGYVTLQGPARISAMLIAAVRKGTIDIDPRFGVERSVGKSVKIPVDDAEGHIDIRATQRGAIKIL
jgi:hypothetical protein